MTVTDDDLYRHTSQFRVWSFTREELQAKKQSCYDRAAKKTIEKLAAKNLLDVVEPLKFEEEQQLIAAYANKVPKIVGTFGMPSNVTATAVSFFRKFYLMNSVMDYHPKPIMCTATFLAFKAENAFVSISQFVKVLNNIVDAKTVLDLEFHLLESLAFTLKVQNALTPLHGFFLDLQTVLAGKEDIKSQGQDIRSVAGKIYDQAKKKVIESLASDACFLYTPPQIALTALHTVDPENVEYYLKKTLEPATVDFLSKLMIECRADMEAWVAPPSEVEKTIDRKLHACLDPDKRGKKRATPSSATPEAVTAKKPKLDEESA